ncbi:MAG: response regulator, partial [Novosphingobium sp.]
MSSKILLVEDDQTTADFIASGLEQEGYLVDRAENGRDGLFLGTDTDYQCIVLDRMLPGLDGMAVLAALRGA